ncbi:superfamily I DNA and RNA helicases and helicase subunits [Candidatus Scalindua japonica]|uniref:Superfamily I DNA and RNA helicases and helicase subunits n=1 Tax=Candidatus Scalindua japonica TaxID=1284222 RepID=A0A286TWP5_9BACT|nr:hypothetical protein [Candidatus Scalindua japonica]GAX60300.1 superfamily I DNA and RNA helicases and helicase subunits [Candidatus Scalindua japonica]
MKAIQRLLYNSFFAVFLLFAIYGCQTTDSTITSGSSDSKLTSVKAESTVNDVEHTLLETSDVEKDVSAASVSATEKTGKTAGNQNEIMENFGNYFLGRLKGHGGAMPTDISSVKENVNRDKQVDDLSEKPANIESRPYIEMEKKLYGKWSNKLKTESYDFHDNGTVIIVIRGPRENMMKLNGNYRIVGAARIKIDFRNDSIASRRPPSYFKISISENAFSLTDEPKKKGGPDGPTTVYMRVE